MKKLWCWRCRQEVRMVDDDEWAVVESFLSDCTKAVQAFRETHGVSLSEVDVDSFYHSALDEYQRITGNLETNYRNLRHHRLSLFGPPCENCTKPLRTPKAKLCAACGTRRKPDH